MDFVLTLLYVMGTYLRPAEVFPALEPYRVMLVLGLVAAAAGAVSAARGKGSSLRAPQLYLVPLFALWAVFTVMAQGWLGGAVPAAEDLSGTVLVFLAVVLSLTSLKRVRLMTATVVALTVFVVGQGVAALYWGYERHVFIIEEGLEQDAARHEWDGTAAAVDPSAPGAPDDAAAAPANPPAATPADAEGEDGPPAIVPRIRSRGVLHDPNDLGQATVAVLPLLLAFWRRDRRLRNLLLVAPPASA